MLQQIRRERISPLDKYFFQKPYRISRSLGALRAGFWPFGPPWLPPQEYQTLWTLILNLAFSLKPSLHIWFCQPFHNLKHEFFRIIFLWEIYLEFFPYIPQARRQINSSVGETLQCIGETYLMKYLVCCSTFDYISMYWPYLHCWTISD